jgi:hypothetical protein
VTTHRKDNDIFGKLLPALRPLGSFAAVFVFASATSKIPIGFLMGGGLFVLLIVTIYWNRQAWGDEVAVTPEGVAVRYRGHTRRDIPAQAITKILVSRDCLVVITAPEGKPKSVIFSEESFRRATYIALRDELIALAPDRTERRDLPAAAAASP